MNETSRGRPSIGAARRALTRRLAAELSPGQRATAALDSRLIFAHALGVAAGELPLADERSLGIAEEERVEALAQRRLAGEPVGRILGRREFWGLDLQLSPDTLEPRPDTETLVEAALAGIAERSAPLTILDLGTGSGAILLALLSELPGAIGVGVDLSLGAVRTARTNAVKLGLGARSAFVQGRWAEMLGGPFNLVVSNPPYVESIVLEALEPEVRGFDPLLALDGGPDGLDAYRRILGDLDRILALGGSAFLEVGAGQARLVAEMAENLRYSTRMHRDLGRHERVVEIHRMRAETAEFGSAQKGLGKSGGRG